MRKIIASAMLLLLPFGSTGALAHAHLDHADPRVGSTVRPAPHMLTLWFTEKLEPAFSTVEVVDANGVRVDEGKADISASVMHVGLKPLGPGTYKVHWHALSVDTHSTEGTFSFQVGDK